MKPRHLTDRSSERATDRVLETNTKQLFTHGLLYNDISETSPLDSYYVHEMRNVKKSPQIDATFVGERRMKKGVIAIKYTSLHKQSSFEISINTLRLLSFVRTNTTTPP